MKRVRADETAVSARVCRMGSTDGATTLVGVTHGRCPRFGRRVVELLVLRWLKWSDRVVLSSSLIVGEREPVRLVRFREGSTV